MTDRDVLASIVRKCKALGYDNEDTAYAILAAGFRKVEWRPIEEAPKDGTLLLVGRFSGKERKGFTGKIVVCRLYGTDPNEGGFSAMFPATHFQYLPEPPT